MEHLDKILLMMVSGMSRDAIIAAAESKLGMARRAAEAALREARARLTLAANYDPDEQLGTAIARLNDCYTKSLAISDIKTCLAAQKELNKLLRLYQQRTEPTDAADEPPDLAAVRRHLEPLNLAGPGESPAELARLAAAELVHHRGRAANWVEPQ